MILFLIPTVAAISLGLIITVVHLIPLNKIRIASVITSKDLMDGRLHTIITINNIDYDLVYHLNEIGIQDASIQFCSDYGDKFGITVKTFKKCVHFIKSTLKNNRELPPFNSKEIHVLAPPEPISNVISEEIVMNKEEDKESDQLSQSSIPVDLEVNGINYIFDFPLVNQSQKKAVADLLAETFCESKANILELVITDKDSVQRECIDPISFALLKQLEI